MATILLSLLETLLCCTTWGVSSAESCSGLSAYELTLDTLWSNSSFPKQYPRYRPNAQWSKLIGHTHTGEHAMWSEGELSSQAVREFAESAVSTGFDSEVQGAGGIFDSFMGTPIRTGVGQSTVKFLANSKNTKLSLIVRLIPSPDWFVGVDRLELCGSDDWIQTKEVDLHPFDAGTDRGFTFTSPNWAEVVRKPISAVTSKSPNHPASSFFYPELKSLPAIARLTLKRIDTIWEDVPVKATSEDLPVPVTFSESSSIKSNMEISSVQTSSNGKLETPLKDDANVSVVAIKPVEEPSVPVVGMEMQQATKTTSEEKKSQRTLKIGLTRSSSKKSKKTENHHARGNRVDCELSDWGEWSACSKTCGYGMRMRTRAIITLPQGDGARCPLMREEQLCGTMRGCGWQHFNQRHWDKQTTERPETSV